MAIGAVDFGGGQFKMAIIVRGRPEGVPGPRGERTMRTAVFVGPDRVLVGQDAIEQGRGSPQYLAKDFKRHLGTTKELVGTHKAKDLVSILFSVAKAQMEQQAGDTVDGIVVSRPANFTDGQTQDLVDGAERAGFKVLAVITEPAAAAFAAAIRRRIGKRHVFLACIDLGSTTLDVSILEIENGVATPIATEGVPSLGGSDFTAVAEDILLAKLSNRVGKPVAKDKLSAVQRLDLSERAESVKVALSRQAVTNVSLPAGGKEHAIEVTQQEFHEGVRGLMDAVLACIDKAFASKAKKPQDMEMVVLTGAPMWSPFIVDRINKHLGVSCKVAADPSMGVVEGAAEYALQMSSGSDRVIPEHGLKLRESTSHDIGVAVIEDAGTPKARVVCALLVKKGTPLPHDQTYLFRLERDNQTDCTFEFVQGPDGAALAQCSPLGSGQMKDLPVEPKRSPRIQIRVVISDKAVAEITITDAVSGKSTRVQLPLRDRPGNAAA